MAEPTEDLVVEIPPDSMTVEIGPDGVPKTVPTSEVNREARARERDADPEVKTLRQRLADAENERQRMAEAATAEREGRLRAEKAADTNTDYAIKAHRHAVTEAYERANADYGQIASAIETLTQMRAMAKDHLRRANEDDNLTPADRATRIAEATDQLTAINSRMETLETGKRGAEGRVGEAKHAWEETERRLQALRDAPPPKREQPQPKIPTTDEFIHTAPPAVQEWLREHREYATHNSDEQGLLNAFANKWVIQHKRDVKSLDTPEFREALDREFFGDNMAPEDPPPRRQAPAERTERPRPSAAPVARGGEFYSSNNPQAGKIRLPPKLAAQVRANGLDPTKYALECVDLIKKGELPKNFLDPDYPHDY
jgi:hypothetical protein